ncbi:class I SAM-dependent methyltransferase [Brevibacillus sp. SYP-B805]|uniref:class I SAM-dependent methyltransferase n=1 Tax=Brevibacillus sp. SYP-B805 TaxID=1578199 RepID=UPI0013EBD63C|nr:class I SAM-dependent methyltransferase [Brevibacillus sp. SYP-B805]NGQ96862.1 class I SAM-dependent methyltransferase [Brevibacillus sp. SYP-B805]
MSNNWTEHVAQAWNEHAANWHSRSAEMWEKGSRKTILPLFTRLVLPQDGPVLDAGCGDGYASRKLAAAGYRVEGLDLSAEMIALAQERTADALPVRFQQGNVAELPFADDHFAGVLAINVVEFAESPLDVLREFHRVLRPSGILLLGILGPTAGPRQFSYRRLYGEAVIQNTMMPWEAKQLAAENGFQLVEEAPVYREGVSLELANSLTSELRQALSFLTLFALRKPEG